MPSGWKPKEKPLTLEEAVELAKKDLAPFWIGSSPLVAAVKSGAKITAYPLDEAFIKRSWLMLFADPLDFAGEDAIQMALEWHRRFGEHELGIIAVMRVPYQRLRTVAAVEKILPKQNLPFTVVIDHDLQLSTAFGAQQLPKLVLLSHGKVVFEQHGDAWHDGAENKIQAFLRQTDPGLPLLPAVDTSSVALTRVRVDFAQLALYPPKAFVPVKGEDGTTRNVARFSRQKLNLPAENLWINGTWIHDGDRILTSDPHATIEFSAPGRHVVVIGQAVAKELATVEMELELEGKAAFEEALGKDLIFDESGRSIVKLREGRSYNVLVNLPENYRSVQLRFTGTSDTAAGLYGLCFAD